MNVEPPKRFSSDDQPQGFTPKVLTNGANGGIISIASNSHPRDLELEMVIQKCIKQDTPVFADGMLARNFKRIPKKENQFITSMHGTERSVMLYGKEIDARTLAHIIRARKDYHNEEIVLISCNTGNSDTVQDCFAQQLADELGVVVHAPTRFGAINSNGEYYSSDKTGFIRDGEFKPFTPRR